MSASKFELTGKVFNKGNVLHIKEMGIPNNIPSVSEQIRCGNPRCKYIVVPTCSSCNFTNKHCLTTSEVDSEEYILGPVNFQAKLYCYNNEENLGKLALYVRLQSQDKNVHNVSISSNSPQLCRFLKAKPANEWHPIYSNNTLIELDDWKFDLEVALMPETPLLNSVYDNTTDVELIGVDGSVRAHGCIMAAASPFVHAALYGDFAEARVKRLNVPDANVAALKLIKMYAYTGFVDAEPAMMSTLLPLASRFLMTSLARACAASLSDLLPDDLIPLLQIDLKPTSNEKPLPPQPQLMIEMLSRTIDNKLEPLKNIPETETIHPSDLP